MSIHADQVISFLQLAAKSDEVGENKYELSLLTATAGGGPSAHKDTEKLNSQLSKVHWSGVSVMVVHGSAVYEMATRYTRCGVCL